MTASPAQLSISLPDGQTASLEDMRSYGETLQSFIRQQEALLPYVASDKRHDEIVDYLQTLADGYNAQLARFRVAEAQRKKMLIVMLMAVEC